MSAAASAASESNLISALSKLKLNTLPGDLYTRRQLNELRVAIQLLDIAIKKYDKLYNYTQYAQYRVGKLVEEVEALASSGVPSNNERIKSKMRNIQEAAAEMATTKNILASNNISTKKLTMDTFIKTLTELSQAVHKVNLEMLKIKADVLFKESPEEEQNELKKALLAVESSINSERRKFVKLKEELTAAESAVERGESAAKLQARLNRLRGNFNSASSMPIAGLSNPQQRNKVGNVIKKIQFKLNATAKGGARKTHKRRTSRRRHTRRN